MLILLSLIFSFFIFFLFFVNILVLFFSSLFKNCLISFFNSFWILLFIFWYSFNCSFLCFNFLNLVVFSLISCSYLANSLFLFFNVFLPNNWPLTISFLIFSKFSFAFFNSNSIFKVSSLFSLGAYRRCR